MVYGRQAILVLLQVMLTVVQDWAYRGVSLAGSGQNDQHGSDQQVSEPQLDESNYIEYTGSKNYKMFGCFFALSTDKA